MEIPQFLPLGDGLELTSMERGDGQLSLHVIATSSGSPCPLCGQPATRMHSRYSRVVKDLPCAGQQVQLILHVRKFFCDTADCARKIFAERLPELVAPWAQMTTRLCQAIQAIGLATCGRLGVRLAFHSHHRFQHELSVEAQWLLPPHDPDPGGHVAGRDPGKRSCFRCEVRFLTSLCK